MSTPASVRSPSRSSTALIGAAVLVASGLAAAGWLAGRGYERGRLGDRFVTVKGLAERDAEADRATWHLGVTATGNVLGEVQAESEDGVAKVRAFLAAQGFAEEDVSSGDLSVTDLLAQPWRNEGIEERRYIVTQSVVVDTSRCDLVERAARALGELVRQGVALQQDVQPRYLFTRVNEIKPAMISEATQAARASAEQFAADSDSNVGGIRRANQGVVSIVARASDGQHEWHRAKTVRVVVTVDYYLED